jgi:hypothetical protein
VGSFTDYLEKKVMNALHGHDTIPSLTTYFALFSGAPSDASGGTEFSFTANYSRVNFSQMSSATEVDGDVFYGEGSYRSGTPLDDKKKALLVERTYHNQAFLAKAWKALTDNMTEVFQREDFPSATELDDYIEKLRHTL